MITSNMITIDKRHIENGVTPEVLKALISAHQSNISKMNRLDDYYTGKHNILNRHKISEGNPNNKLVHPFPKYVTDMHCGYMFGNDITYKPREDDDLTPLLDALKQTDANTHDAELGKDLSVFGVGYELVYMSCDANPMPKLALIDPRNAFIAYDDTVETTPLFGVRYFPRYKLDNAIDCYVVTVYTATEMLEYTVKSLNDTPTYIGSERHYFGRVPLVEYWNNEEGLGDYEHVLSLVDAYDVLQSDRINDKERFVDAILLIVNAQLDTDDKEDEEDKEDGGVYDMLRNAILELPEKADARYLTKMLNETEIEILSKSLRYDIHKFSHTPDFTDENFAGNLSGVAMSYKLLAMEYLAKTKERFFTDGLRQRLALFASAMELKGYPAIDPAQIEIVFNRQLPVNMLETAQIVNMLRGGVSNETLLTLLPFVKDVPLELEKLNAEQSLKLNREANALQTYDNRVLL